MLISKSSIRYFISLNQSIYFIKLHSTGSPRPRCLHNKLGQCGRRSFWDSNYKHPGKRLSFLCLCLCRVDIQLEFIGQCIPTIYNYFFFLFSHPHQMYWNGISSIHSLNCSSCSGLQLTLGERRGGADWTGRPSVSEVLQSQTTEHINCVLCINSEQDPMKQTTTNL